MIRMMGEELEVSEYRGRIFDHDRYVRCNKHCFNGIDSRLSVNDNRLIGRAYRIFENS